MNRMSLRLGLAFFLALGALQIAGAQKALYLSNGFGMRLQPIEPYRRDEYAYVLEVEKIGPREARRLYENGKEVSRWEITYGDDGAKKEEREFTGGVISARRVYGKAGEIALEETYADGKIQSTASFLHVNSRLSSVKVTAPDGRLIYTQRYFLSDDGGLRRVERANADGSTSSSIYFAGGEGVREERDSSAGMTYVTRYDERGRTVGKEKWLGEEIQLQELFVYRADSNLLATSMETLYVDGTRIERGYDENGRLLSVTENLGQTVVSQTDYIWDDEGHNTVTRRRSAEGIEEWHNSYGADGTLAKEEYFKRGALEKAVIYTSKDERYEELYRDGEMFLRAFYKGDVKVKEQVYEKGDLVRERTFE
jgi:antitoxin component YwqK of YwqJK toxin-antitoxin module